MRQVDNIIDLCKEKWPQFSIFVFNISENPMSKHKKGKVIQLKPVQQSPENYIKTQARALPIVECLISDEWEDSGICNVIIARKHKSGNLTVGVYLVDLYCLGVKDAHYEFNIDPEDYDYVKLHNGDLEECEYVLAHNVIYGALEFADEYGFKPHKDFAVAQYILEEDNEDVPLMEIEFGLEGMPCFLMGPYDDAAKIKSITATLNRTAGPGNFTIMDPDDTVDNEDFDFDDDFDPDDLMDELEDELEESYARFPKILKKINKVYDGLVRTPEAKEILEKPYIGSAYKVSEGKVKNEYTVFDNAEQEAEYNRLKDKFTEGEFDPAIKGTKKAILKYPAKIAFYDLLLAAYSVDKQFDKCQEIVREMYKLFPGILMPAIAYANLLLEEGEAGKGLAGFNGKSDLNELYPDRKVFHVIEAAEYYACMCRLYIALDDLDSADLYMNAIFKKDLIKRAGNTLVMAAVTEMCTAKMKKIEEVGLRKN
jgi:tetratricopeptide (TPR) repeat protein